MITHTNNCIAQSVVNTLSKLEDFPTVLRVVTREAAIVAYRSRTKTYTSLANHVWFLSGGIAYRCNAQRCQVMSYYNN